MAPIRSFELRQNLSQARNQKNRSARLHFMHTINIYAYNQHLCIQSTFMHTIHFYAYIQIFDNLEFCNSWNLLNFNTKIVLVITVNGP